MTNGDSTGLPLKVDPERLSQLGSVLKTAAAGLPDAPAPFTATGADEISLAIKGKLPAIENVIQEVLPQVKAGAQDTASKMLKAAAQYLGTDQELAAKYQQHQFDSAASPVGSGGAGGSSSVGGAGGATSTAAAQSDSMSQMMSMPMQMANQAAQVPAQMMSAAASVPQSLMQGVQQVSQMAGGLGGNDGSDGDEADRAVEDRTDDDRKAPGHDGAAAGQQDGGRAPADDVDGQTEGNSQFPESGLGGIVPPNPSTA